MPIYLVYGAREVNVVSTVTCHFPEPETTITRFHEDGGVNAVFLDNPEHTLKELGLHMILLDAEVSLVIWQPMIVTPSLATPAESEGKIAEILCQRFNGRKDTEKGRFKVPIPFPPFVPIDKRAERLKKEYELRKQVVDDIDDVMKKHGLTVRIGLARW